MAITEIGESIQIRILYEDGEKLKKLKESPEEPWYKVINRLLINYDKLKKQVKSEQQVK